MTEAERCWRCSAEMEWRHGTWQCARCHFKLGCCEGEPQSNCDAPAVSLAQSESRPSAVLDSV
jgi:hypothetical protein